MHMLAEGTGLSSPRVGRCRLSCCSLDSLNVGGVGRLYRVDWIAPAGLATNRGRMF